jgi:nitrogen-specific signal transduction histidine kinase
MTMATPPEDRPSADPTIEELLHFILAEHKAIRTLAHDIASPIGILRLAMHVLRSMKPDNVKREQYYETMSQAIDRLEVQIRQMRALTETPPGGQPPDGGHP